MSSTLPLLAERDLAAPLAWQAGSPISAAQFLAEAAALAQQLPAGRPVNLCQDRYHFALGLAAALMRGQTSLMPPNAMPDTLAQLGPGEPAYALVDHDDAVSLPVVRVSRGVSGSEPASTGMPRLAPSQEAVCLLTSGSTGAPQPHAKRWGALVTNIAGEALRLAELIGQTSIAGLNVVATVPPQHSYGLESTVLLALLGGAAFDAGRPFYPADVADALGRVPRPRALVTTPFHLKTLLQSNVALPEVDLILSATAPLSPQLAAQAEAAFQGRLVEIYGCTEAGQVAARRTTDGEVWTTLGDLRLRHEAGEDGERCIVEGGHVLSPTPLADVLELLDDRRFRLLGRANDLIHVAGKRSSLSHLNFQLNHIDGIEDGAFWLPDDLPDGVVRPVAFVVAPRLDARTIIAALRERLEAAFVPRRVVHVDHIPREATGKMTAQGLARFARQTLARLDGHAFDVPADHPAFAGHFPGHPILPGVVLLGWVMQALAADPTWASAIGGTPVIEQVKFLAPVGPGQRVVVSFTASGRGVAFEIRRGETVVAVGHVNP